MLSELNIWTLFHSVSAVLNITQSATINRGYELLGTVPLSPDLVRSVPFILPAQTPVKTQHFCFDLFFQLYCSVSDRNVLIVPRLAFLDLWQAIIAHTTHSHVRSVAHTQYMFICGSDSLYRVNLLCYLNNELRNSSCV